MAGAAVEPTWPHRKAGESERLNTSSLEKEEHLEESIAAAQPFRAQPAPAEIRLEHLRVALHHGVLHAGPAAEGWLVDATLRPKTVSV